MTDFDYQVRSRAVVPDHVAMYVGVKLESYFDKLIDALVVDLVAEIKGVTLESCVVKYPIDWIEAFKERWFPNWLKLKYPIKYKTVKLKTVALLPYVPKDSFVVHYMEGLNHYMDSHEH